jgi:hypothetical protein
MIKHLVRFAIIATVGFSLSACGEDEKAKTETPPKPVEKTQPAPKVVEQKSDQDMTPAEAVENMKRDAGIVADKAEQGYEAVKEKAIEGYDATKEAVKKALDD